MATGKRPFTEMEFRQLSAAAEVYFSFPTNIREKTIWTLQAHTGLRINEVLQLQIRDVFGSEGVSEVLNLHRCYTKTNQKGRFIPLSPAAKEALEKYMEVVKPWVLFAGPTASLWVTRVRERGICNMVNVPPTDKTVRLHLKKACLFCGIDPADISTHSWRKMFAKRIYEKLGHDLIGAQYALGHASIKSTVHYLSSCDTKVDQAIRDLWGDSSVYDPLPPRSVADPVALRKHVPNGLPFTKTLEC